MCRVESAALAGHADAATSLRALFHTGLSYQGRSFVRLELGEPQGEAG